MLGKIKVVTGYIPLAEHPRSPAEYGALGEKLRELKYPVQPFYANVTSTWLYQMIDALPFAPTWSVADNGLKNTLPYHCVQHEKFNWLYQAAKMDPEPDTFVWVDYGLAHIPRWTSGGMNDFLARVRKDDLAIPGCHQRAEVRADIPCWRFCGGLFVVPRQHIGPLKNLIQAMALLHCSATHNIEWEVNCLARVEQTDRLPIRWYKADHDASIYENY